MKTVFDFRFSIFDGQVARWLMCGFAAAVAFVMPAVALAQGCAMCYTTASAAKKPGIEALQDGVFILLFPPLLMFAAILWHTFRRRSAADSGEPLAVSAPLRVESLGN